MSSGRGWNVVLLIGVASAVLFFRAATYERMSPCLWTISSLGLTFIFGVAMPSVGLLLAAQLALFIIMWWYNARRPNPS
jgi:membrane-bound ClpP family serine protease